ncbi:hypothetical protein OSCT_0857 [Oscillochloris trichoides DG-6]|uniref:Glycosyltransferase RgtA/B/C/D-like domain-containing protein n=1 Tax=Oscillochloris trichoides DG-6 TaxID=765420 RepID=E1IC06_9CHLR|nr:hypothetical protein [Oscillochloris trichoides]EFO81268.1 hypothetical protein OSCT_0857 [Oscillochloris trichoides DG-6]
MKQPATTDTPSVKAQNPTIITTISAIIVALIVMWGCWWYLSSTPLQTKDHFSFGSIASLGLQGFYDAETDTEWRGYRWTNGAATLDLDVQGDGGHILALTLAAPQPDATTVPVTLTLNQQPLATFDISQSRRHYLVLAPAEAVSRGSNQLGINSPTFQVTGNPHDLRKLGVVAFDLEWQATQFPAWMLPTQAVALAITAALLFVCLQRAGIPWLFNLITIILFLAISISMRHSDVRFLYRWHALLSTGGIAALLGLSTLVLQPQPTPLVLPWRQWFQHHWQALVGYTVLTGIMLYQILQNFTTAIPGYHGDAYEYLWKFQVFSDYLINKHQTPTFFSWLMYPEGFELANSEITTANTLLGVPLTWLFGPTVSFNILVLISAISSGFLTYLLACRLGVSRLAAWVGAIAFAFAIRRTQQMMGHMPLMPTQYLVLALYGLEGMISRRRTWDAFLTGMGLALTTWASLYYGVTFIFIYGWLCPLTDWVAQCCALPDQYVAHIVVQHCRLWRTDDPVPTTLSGTAIFRNVSQAPTHPPPDTQSLSARVSLRQPLPPDLGPMDGPVLPP